MQYMIMIFGDDASWDHATPADLQQVATAHMAFQADVGTLGGSILGGEALGRLRESVTIRDGLVTDGPFLESKEMLGGYYLIGAEDLDQAIAIARRCPAELGVEVRPIQDLTEIGFRLTGGPHKEHNTMKFLVLIYSDEAQMESAPPEAMAEMMDKHRAFSGQVVELGGTILGGEALESSQTATSFRGDVVTDGPFVESKEALGGFYVIEVATKEQAIAIGKVCPTNAGIEIRPIWDTSSI